MSSYLACGTRTWGSCSGPSVQAKQGVFSILIFYVHCSDESLSQETIYMFGRSASMVTCTPKHSPHVAHAALSHIIDVHRRHAFIALGCMQGQAPREMIRISVVTLTGKHIEVDIAQDAMAKVRNCTIGCYTLTTCGHMNARVRQQLQCLHVQHLPLY